jgi:hypothetical protein
MITDKLPAVVYVNSKMLPTQVGKLVRVIGRVDQVGMASRDPSINLL